MIKKNSIVILTVLTIVLAIFSSCSQDSETETPIWYISINLDTTSVTTLKQYAQANMPWPEEDSIYYGCEHITLVHKDRNRPDLMELYRKRAGEIVSLNAVQVGKSDKAFAMKVDCGMETSTGVPHITLAVNVTNGGTALESVNIQDWEELETPIPLKGVIFVNPLTPESIDK